MVEPQKINTTQPAGGLESADIWGDAADDPMDEFASMTDEEIRQKISEITSKMSNNRAELTTLGKNIRDYKD